MTRFFLFLYEFFVRHRAVCYSLAAGSFLILLYFALQVRFEEDVTRFFPDRKESKTTETVFQNLKIKDKIIVMFYTDTVKGVASDPDRLIEAGEHFQTALLDKTGETYIKDIFSEVDEEIIGKVTDFIYTHLPVFMTEDDYLRIDSLLTDEGVAARMKSNYNALLSPMGTGVRPIILRDPLGLGTRAFESLKDFELTANYTIYSGRLFSEDMSTLIQIITPVYGTGTTGKNDLLIEAIEEQLAIISQDFPEIKGAYFGGPSVGVYNARQIKRDTMLTLTIALVIIITFILLVFKSRSAVFLILLPVIYGAVFSLGIIWFIKGSVSAIAIGAGAAIFGVALSYSIHVLSHFNHVTSIRQLIEELVYPMTVGSFTTVGAFLGLLFTSSDLLRDFGLFSALALVGTTLFCLVFLPHFLRIEGRREESGLILRFIEKINGYAYEKNKILVGSIIILFIVSLFLSVHVGFDSDMRKLSFEPRHIKAAELKLNELFQSDDQTILFVTVGENPEKGIHEYRNTNRRLSELRSEGLISEFASAERILIPESIQKERIDRWNRFWTKDKKEFIRDAVSNSATSYKFRPDAFNSFFESLDAYYQTFNLFGEESPFQMADNWLSTSDSAYMFISQVRLSDTDKKQVYDRMNDLDQLVIFDRAYFANQWVVAINNDFYLILYICSFLIFFALLISYGRIELTLMTFTPMAVSWVIILGIMAVTGIEFNIVNIILATFIFGLGDDFSIFIMDGLQQEYRTGKRLLTSHKTAIFFSSFTAVVGLGVLVFAKHPALQSISLISILGMTSVVLVSYTILPILFRFFIADPAAKGNFPYTFKGLLVTLWFYNAFVVGCSIAIGIASILILLPVRRNRKKIWFSAILMYMLRGFLKAAWIARHRVDNPGRENFSKPAVIVANHQSFIDILILLSLAPKFVMVTNNWVWNSPFFGRIVRYADFVQTAEGYEVVLERLKKKVELGYSVIVFPEGTRSIDGKMRRFHKGAFYIAEKLKLDLVPVVLYGTGMIISKRQPFYVKRGILSTTILPRIPFVEYAEAGDYRKQTKEISLLMRQVYQDICRTFATANNPFYYQQLITNYIYKGPVEEWYIRVKVTMENKYDYFNRLVPRSGQITDIGCGYGPLSYLLMMLSDERKVLGIDYDEDKIALAAHNFSCNERIRFVCGNALEVELPDSDVFILNDMLHYMDFDSQDKLLSRCVKHLNKGGRIIIRDGDSDNKKNHRLTRFTEFLSTRLFAFNKRENDLFFPTKARFEDFAAKHDLQIIEKPNDQYTSNTIFVLFK